MKKILLVIRDLKGNGAERCVINFAERFKKSSFKPYIICFKKDVQLPISDDIPLLIFSEKFFRFIPRNIRGRIIAPFLDLFIKTKIGKPNLVLSNLMPADRLLAYSKLSNVFFIIHSTTSVEISSHYPKRIKKEMSERVTIYSKKPCICVSDGVKADLITLLKNDNDQIRTIHNGIDSDHIIQSSLDTPLDLIHDCILHIGKFNNAKRQDRLLKAYAAINCDIPLVFIGVGPKMEEVKQLTKRLNLSHKVHFLGYKKNPFPYMKSARIMVLCSDFEGLGLVLLEAICLGTPVISSNCPSGPSEIVDDFNLFETDSSKAFENLLSRAVETPDVFRSALRDEFKIDYCIEKYIKLME